LVDGDGDVPDGFRRSSTGKLLPIGKPFLPGNEESRRGGRPKGLAKRIREMVGDDPGRVANVLFDILENQSGRERSSDRIAAAREILDRGWGKAPQAHTGENGEGDIRVIVRHILDTRDKPVAQAHLAPDNSVVHLTIDHDGDRDG